LSALKLYFGTELLKLLGRFAGWIVYTFRTIDTPYVN